MARRAKVTRFWRGARRHPKWDLGTPPAARRRRLLDPRSYLKVAMVGALGGLVLLPSFADAVNGIARGAHGGEDCRVAKVIDGDTISIWCPARGLERARIDGYDTAELFDPECAAELALAYRGLWRLRWMIWTGGDVSIVRTGTDRFGRAVVSLFIDGRDVRHVMIAEDVARPYDGGHRDGWCA